MKKLMLTLALGVATAGAAASELVTVEKFSIAFSIQCSDGRVVDAHHASLLVPVTDGGRPYNPPMSKVDTFSLNETMRNTCESGGLKGVKFNVRNVTESGFVVTGESISQTDDSEGPGFSGKSNGGEVAMPLVPHDGVLHVQVTAVSKQTTPDFESAVKLIDSTPVEMN
jgi:hypothetical protein